MFNKILRYNLYYFLTYIFKLKFFKFKTDSYYFVLLIRKENKNNKIWTPNYMVIKPLILYQKIISI